MLWGGEKKKFKKDFENGNLKITVTRSTVTRAGLL